MSGGIDYVDELPPRAGVVIVGGGVVGAATAFFAARAGLQPLVIEQRPALASLTTAASTGAFRLQFDNLEELRLVGESVELFLNFQEVTGQRRYDLGIKQQGYLWATSSPEGVERQRRLVARQHEWGQTDIELLDGDEVRRRFPYVSDNVLQARFRAGDGFLNPRALAFGLIAGARVPVALGCRADTIETAGGRVAAVRTDRGTVACDAAVVATGPLSQPFAGRIGLSLPIETVPRQKVVLPDVPEVPAHAPMTIDDDTGAHWRPAFAGASVLFTDPNTAPTPPTEDVAPDHRVAFALLDPGSRVAVARIAPFWREVWERGAISWVIQSGQYTMTPDHRPLIGEAGVEGLYVNTGYSGHGIMGGAAGSRHLVDLMSGKLDPAQNPFRLDRIFEARELDVL